MEDNTNNNDSEWCVVNENSSEQHEQEQKKEHKNDLHIVMILDESGSMGPIRNDIIGSVNTFIDEQKNLKQDNTAFTFVKFSNNISTTYEKKLLSQVDIISCDNYKPSGNTALYDAIGQTINKYVDEKEVFIIIVTDGEENSSREFNHKKVTDLIESKKKDNWNFIYLSADLSTMEQGSNIGITSTIHGEYTRCNNIAVGYENLSRNISENCSRAVREYRTTGKMMGMGSGLE
jgi:hypothetical protein